MKINYPIDHSINSISSEEDLSSNNNLFYFYFDDDNLQSKNITSFPLSGQCLSKFLEMIHFLQDLNITLNGRGNQQQNPTCTSDKMAANPLQAMIELIKLTLKPERIYQVDYPVSVGNTNQITDLLIIIPDSCQQPFSKMEPLLELAKLQHQEVFCTLMKSEKLFQVLERGDFYFSFGCTANNLVYANTCCDQEALPVVDLEKLNHLKAHAKLNFYSHLVKAEKFLKAAKNIKDDSGDGVCLFMLHQATEITLRGIILAFSGMDKRTHELSVLIKHSSRFCPAINAILPARTDEEKYLLQIFDEAYFKSRYKPEYSPERHLEALLLPKVEQIQQVARESFEITIAQLER